MEEKIRKILACFEIKDQEDIDVAIDCISHPEKWQKFMEDFIPSHFHAHFLEQLTKNSITSNSKEEHNFQQEFYTTKETPISILHINTLPIIQYKWSQQLIDEIHEKYQQRFENSLKKSKTFNQFLENQVEQIFDLVSRKGDLKEYFDLLKLTSRQIKEKSNVITLVQAMYFTDFVILLIKKIQQRTVIGQMLSNLALSVPVMFQVNEKIIFDQNACRGVFGSNEFLLVLNIGTQRVQKCGKTSLIAKMMGIDEGQITSTHFRNTLCLYKKLNFSKSGNTLLADFNGSFSESLNDEIIRPILRASKHTSLLILHINEIQLMNGLLETKLYAQLCQYPAKILIYVRDSQKFGPVKLMKKIPNNIKGKTAIRILKNFKLSPIQMEHKQQMAFICSQKLNIIDTKTSIIQFLNEKSPQKSKKREEKVQSIMNILNDINYAKEKVIENTCMAQELSRIRILINQETKSVQRMNQYKQKENELLLALKKSVLTPFIKKAIQIINYDRQCLQIFTHKLYQWKQSKIGPLRQQYLNLTDQLHQTDESKEIIQLIRINQEKRSHFDFSIDKVINQIIIYNENIKEKSISEIISRYHRQSLLNICPINVIDGNTLQFGNSALIQVIKFISDKYAHDKKVFVVSVIGAQSSAKSTLLNFLFRCKFETSAGRCTKGVYMSLCEMEEMMIIVLDTEGLLSVSERDIAFDHQIVTFILKISNLIIINNKGELTSTLKQMLEVCLYVLQCLHKDQNKKSYDPQKVLFALRDQTRPDGHFQQQMAAQIKNALDQMKKTSDIDYRNFFSIETSDIMSLPNAFIEVNGLIPKTGVKTIYHKNFQKCILGMRKRIVNCLRNSTPKSSIKHFYNEAKSVWETVRKCGREIMNFKSINEIVTKKRLQQILQEQYLEFDTILQQNFQAFFNKISQITSSKQLDRSIYFDEIFKIKNHSYGILAQLFQTSCDEICMNKEWIKYFLPKIERLCSFYETTYSEKLAKKVKNLKNSEKNQALKERLFQITKNLLEEKFSENIVMKKFGNEAKVLLDQLNIEKQSFSKSHLQLEIKSVFENMLASEKYFSLKINNIRQCLTFMNQIGKNPSKMNLFITQNSFFANQSDYASWEKSFIRVSRNFQRITAKFIRTKKIVCSVDIHNDISEFLSLIVNAIAILSKQIHGFKRKYAVLSVKLNQPFYRIYLYGRLYGILQQQIFKNKLSQIEQQYLRYESDITQYKESLRKIIACRGDFKKTLQNDIEQLKKDIVRKKSESIKLLMQSKMDKVALRLKPQNIFSKALHETLLNNEVTDKKYHYIQCFKIIKNMNRYLFDIMCESPEISTRSVNALKATNQIIEEIRQQLKLLIINFTDLSQKDISLAEIKEIFIQHNFIGLANFKKEELGTAIVFQSIKAALINRFEQILQETQSKLRQTDLNQAMVLFIKNILKNKVIGCQVCCPICGMKCMHQSNHGKQHQVLKNCHSLASFATVSYRKSDQPALNMCQQKKNVQCRWVHDEQVSENLKVYIQKYYPEWESDFPNVDEEEKFQRFEDVVKLKKIWANIEKAYISTICRSMKPSSKQQIRDLVDEQQLNQEDLNRQYEDILTKKNYLLRDY